MIRYSCNHCDTEIGSIPLESVKELLVQMKNSGEGKKLLSVDHNGTHIRCICEECEKTLRMFPDYYTLKNWLQ